MAKETGRKEGIIIFLLIVLVVGIGIFAFFSFKKSESLNFEAVKYPKDATCEDMINFFAQEKELDIRQPICTHYYGKDPSTGKDVLTRCMCNLIFCDYKLFGRIQGIKECEMRQIEINVTLIQQISISKIKD